MSTFNLTIIFFFYGLAFFSMGLIVTLEGGRGSDPRLRHALRSLAGFGLLHGAHEWFEIFQINHMLPGQDIAPLAWESFRLTLLAFSFLLLTAFGASLLSPNERIRRLSLLIPLVQAAIWGFGLLMMRSHYPIDGSLLDVADVWTRYAVGIPGALVACAGLITQQGVFQQVGMTQFGRDSLWAAVAFAMYGVVGQFFTRVSPLPPSNIINQDLFLQLFGFPVQLLRAGAAVVVAVFVMRFLRSFEVETQRQIAALQAARLREAQRREALRGELLGRVVAAQEAERRRIARELHDETGQALTAIGLGLRGVASSLRQDEDKTAQNLRQLEVMVAHSLDELQRVISDLRPAHLDDLGLPAALRWYAGEIQSRVPLQVSVEVNGGEHQLPSSVNTALFRVAQEALTNVIKHAQADHAEVRLRFLDDAIELAVEDDGIGFEHSRIYNADQSAWGLLGIQERTSLLGGEFILDSQPGEGACIQVTIPYCQEAEEENGDTPVIGG